MLENQRSLSDLSANGQKIVAFVEIGHSKATVTVSKYKKENQIGQQIIPELLLHHSNKNLGGRNLDWAVMQ